jgi:hypothetical protein
MAGTPIGWPEPPLRGVGRAPSRPHHPGMRFKTIALGTLMALAVATGLLTAEADARSTSVAFTRAPASALQGKVVPVAVATKPGTAARCTLVVRYADGATTNLGTVPSLQGRALWSWRVPQVAQPGRARLNATCGRHGSAARLVTIVGTLIPPKITVVEQGFSVRARAFSGSTASFGLMLRNSSPNADALNVYILVNFVMADGQAIGTKSETLDGIAAGTTFAYGGTLNFPGAAPIDRLEVVIKVGERQPRTIHKPLVQSMGLAPSRHDATWVGEINGELVNNHPALNISRAKIYAVVYDPAGAIIGGGAGYASALLPPGTRQVFALTSGVDAIPWSRAHHAVGSSLATFTP